MVDDDGFLARWSRRKVQAKSGSTSHEPAPPAPLAPPGPVAPVPSVSVESAPTPPPAEAPPAPTLGDVARLSPGDAVGRFVAPGVDETVKRAALKKLFADPHFNVMDGLDTYIDDYGRPDPIPLALLRQMNQSRALGLFDDEGRALPPPGAPDDAAPSTANDAVPAVTTDGAGEPALSESGAVAAEPDADSDPAPHEDPDLRLQQDDAAGRPGSGKGPRP